jgi:hypothetical protein
MVLLLNSYQRYIDLKSTEELEVYNGALHGFKRPLTECQ